MNRLVIGLLAVAMTAQSALQAIPRQVNYILQDMNKEVYELLVLAERAAGPTWGRTIRQKNALNAVYNVRIQLRSLQNSIYKAQYGYGHHGHPGFGGGAVLPGHGVAVANPFEACLCRLEKALKTARSCVRDLICKSNHYYRPPVISGGCGGGSVYYPPVYHAPVVNVKDLYCVIDRLCENFRDLRRQLSNQW